MTHKFLWLVGRRTLAPFAVDIKKVNNLHLFDFAPPAKSFKIGQPAFPPQLCSVCLLAELAEDAWIQSSVLDSVAK